MGCGPKSSASNVDQQQAAQSQPALPVELTGEAIWGAVQQNSLAHVVDLLAILPDSARNNFVLMEASQSLQQASAANPRIIMFGADARFLMAVSTDPSDPLYDSVEMAELETSGQWKFQSIDFSASNPTLSTDSTSCAVCHGSQPHPIWGSYPNWPGAFGNPDDQQTAAQYAKVMSFAQSPLSDSNRMGNLGVKFNDNAHKYSLPGRYYGPPNTVFTGELGLSITDGLVSRLRATQSYLLNAQRFLYFMECQADGNMSTAEANLRAVSADASGQNFDTTDMETVMGLTPEDFKIYGTRASADDHELDGGYWDAETDQLISLLELRFLDDVAQQVPAVASAVASTSSQRALLIKYGWEETGADRIAAYTSPSSLKAYYMQPSQSVFKAALGDDGQSGTVMGPQRQSFCNALVPAITSW